MESSNSSNSSDNVLEMIRPFDPISTDAEDQYDAVVRRLNRIRARTAHLVEQQARLEAQFIDGDLCVQSGPRKGEPLSTRGRKRRLARLVEVSLEHQQLVGEERFFMAALARMNAELDRWARETYGA